MKIPSPTDRAGVAEYVDKMFREMAANPRRRDWEGEAQGTAFTEGQQTGFTAVPRGEAERGLNLYLGNHFTTPTPTGTVRIVLNRVQNAILAIMAIQAGEPPQITFTPRETGEPPLCFINTKLPAGQLLAQEYLGEAQANGDPWQPTDPLPDEVVAEVKQDIALDQQRILAARQSGSPEPQDALPPEVLVEVTDATGSEMLQTIFDALWESQDAQFVFAENVLNKNILGWQPTHFEWDDDNRRPIETNIHPKQVFFDGLRSDLRRCQMAGYDEPISADEAIARYPQWADAINLEFTEGTPVVPGSRPYDPAYNYQTALWREWGFIRHFWIRNQPYPMTPQQAEDSGKLTAKDVPDDSVLGGLQPGVGPDVPGAVGAAGAESAADSAGDHDRVRPDDAGGYGAGGQPVGTNAEPGAGADVLSGGGAESPVAAQPAVPQIPTRRAYFHPATGQEVTPSIPDPRTGGAQPHPLWPVRYGIRYVAVIRNTTVDDRECEFPDIPLPTNVNLPVPFSIYGQGEPVRLEGIQMALNYLLSAMVTHQRYNAYPPELVLESIEKEMSGALKSARSKPGQRIVVPDHVLETIKDLKNAIVTLDPPQLPTDFWKLLQFLVEMIDKEGNQSDVMAGNAAPGWSGDAISSLQNAAANVIRAKSMMTELYLRQRARLYEHCIVFRMTPQDWSAYCSKYPPQVLEAFHNRNKTIERDLSVQIQSGSGASKQAKTNNLIAARTNGIPISTPTIMENLGADPEAELQRQSDYDKKAQAMGIGASGQAPPPASGPPAPNAAGGEQGQPAPLPVRPAGRVSDQGRAGR